MFGVNTASQGARIHFCPDIPVGTVHVPMIAKGTIAGVAALLCVMQFREASV